MPLSGREHFAERLDNGFVDGNATNEVDRLFKGAFLQGDNHAGDALAESI
ncbi:hypothetical protein ES703_68813 [subsurface metagenome]